MDLDKSPIGNLLTSCFKKVPHPDSSLDMVNIVEKSPATASLPRCFREIPWWECQQQHMSGFWWVKVSEDFWGSGLST